MRATRGIFGGVVVATCGSYAAITMVPVVAHGITGSPLLAGVPVAAFLAGAGIGATPVAALMRRVGHQTAFTATYLVGAVGCAVAAAGATTASFAMLLVGVAAVGAGHAANQLARYAAAELHPEQRRGAIIGWLVWAQAVGAVLGPLSSAPAGRLAVAAGWPAEGGAFVVGVLLFAAAAASHVIAPCHAASGGQSRTDGDQRPASRVTTLPTVQIAFATMVVSLMVMLLVMTVTPVHVHSAGHGVAAVGAIMSAHTFGMFAFAPVAGRLTARSGSIRVIVGGVGALALAAAAGALAPASSQLLLGLALFVLGFGWCLGFVAASTLLTQGLAPATRSQLQGRVEAVTWVAGAGAAVLAGVILDAVSFPLLNVIASTLLLIPLGVIVWHRVALPRLRTDAAGST